MQAVKETVRCPRCGCIALPDAIKCPKCGAAYNGNGASGILNTITCLPAPIAQQDAVAQVTRAYYQLTCPRHGKIHVRATVISSPIKCPFCSQT